MIWPVSSISQLQLRLRPVWINDGSLNHWIKIWLPHLLLANKVCTTLERPTSTWRLTHSLVPQLIVTIWSPSDYYKLNSVGNHNNFLRLSTGVSTRPILDGGGLAVSSIPCLLKPTLYITYTNWSATIPNRICLLSASTRAHMCVASAIDHGIKFSRQTRSILHVIWKLSLLNRSPKLIYTSKQRVPKSFSRSCPSAFLIVCHQLVSRPRIVFFVPYPIF